MTPAGVRYEVGGDRSRWLFVSGRSFVAAVEPGVGEPILDALWWLAESDFAEVEAVVGAFPLRGEDEVASFAVASFGTIPEGRSETLVTVVVRGDACVDVFSVGGARRFSADGVQPWLLADFRSVTGFALSGTDSGPMASAQVHGTSFPLQAGGAEGCAIVWSLHPIPRTGEGGSGNGPVSMTGPGSREDPRGGSDGDRGLARDESFDDEGLPDEDWPSVEPARDEGSRGMRERTDSDSWSWSDVPQRPGTTGPSGSRGTRARAGAGLLDDDTLVLSRRPLPPMPGASGAGSERQDRQPEAAYSLRVGVSETILLDQLTIVGRNPRSPGIPYGDDARLVTVASPELEVSASHVQLQQVGDAVVVTDLRSTNGTFILHEDRAPERLRPGESRVLPAGAALDIGDGNIIEIAHISPAR